ncbi:MAG TPA: hypothetical protein VGD29_02520 [Actinoplanes sp.]|jgi:hypothetical protein
MPSTDAKRPQSEEDEGNGLAGTLLIGALVVLFVIAIVALVYFAVAG